MKKLYYGGDILTMERTRADYVLIEDGVILGTGTGETPAAAGARLVDLQGLTLMPSFIDAHSHITAYARTLGLLNLSGVKSAEEMAAIIARYSKTKAPGEWIIGFGYDNNEMGAHPGKSVLDAAAPGNPVAVTHASGHMGVMNTRALEALGVWADTPNPKGGVIGRDGSGALTGYLEETAFTGLSAKIPGPDEARELELLKKAQDDYLGFGITTAQDGVTKEREWGLLKRAANAGALKMDVVSYADMGASGDIYADNPDYHVYNGALRLGGYKIFLDGSPQGRTAWLSAPYENSGDYRGYPIYDDGSVSAFMKKALSAGAQILAHCNGDAAAEQMINAYRRALQETGRPGVRPVMIHAQFVREDQLEKMAALGILASFFTAHTYFWGDVHLRNLGGRAALMSPARSAARAGVAYTFHQDTPVIMPDMLFTAWCAVNRVSKSGAVMGAGERVTLMEALGAITRNAAYQYFEENAKGSIKAGKRADLVILSENPLKCPDIRKIRVVETIKDGKTLYGGL